VTDIIDFAKQIIHDPDGKLIPPQQFFFITLEKGVKFAVHTSGTEPKIKIHLFAETKSNDKSQLGKIKEMTSSLLQKIKRF
jgi:phosphoglucomutase